jgi:hypothetical protein
MPWRVGFEQVISALAIARRGSQRRRWQTLPAKIEKSRFVDGSRNSTQSNVAPVVTVLEMNPGDGVVCALPSIFNG